MNDSFQSTQDVQKNSHNLYQEINAITPNRWNNDDLVFNEFCDGKDEGQLQPYASHFELDLSLQSKVNPPSQDSVSLEKQDPFKVEVEVQEKQSQILEENKGSDNIINVLESPAIEPIKSESNLSSNSQKNPSQLAVTIAEQSMMSKTSEQQQTQDLSTHSVCLKSFLNLNSQNYRPHVENLKELFNKVKMFSKGSLDNLKMYKNYLELKMKQEIEEIKVLDEEEINIEKIKENEKDLEDQIYFDERIVLNYLVEKNRNNKIRIKEFYKSIKSVYDKLNNLWRKINEKRQKRQKGIQEQIIKVIDRIELQTEEIIKCKLANERNESSNLPQNLRSRNPYLCKDKYLELKYLIQRQNSYLHLIEKFNAKIIEYVINIFSKEEVQMAPILRTCMMEYGEAYLQCYDSENQVINQKLDQVEDHNARQSLKGELFETLFALIPKELYNCNPLKMNAAQDKLEFLISDLNHQLQNTIFMSTIEMNHEYILFRNEALWKNSSNFINTKQNVGSESQQILANQSKALSPQTKTIKASSNDTVKVVVVLTSNYHLHFQNDDKIATLMLSDIKLSKKGRNIVISDKNKGFTEYFSFNKQLGVLEFDSIEEADTFSQKISYALRKIG